jgi:hypothetical protein
MYYVFYTLWPHDSPTYPQSPLCKGRPELNPQHDLPGEVGKRERKKNYQLVILNHPFSAKFS